MKKSLFVAVSTLLVFSSCSTPAVVQNNNSSSQAVSTTVETQKTQQTAESNSAVKTYKDDTNGITFDYPSNLSAKRSGDRIVVLHTIPFKHSPPCDFIGGGTELTELTDFDLSLEVYKKSLKDTAVDSQDASFAADNMSGNEMKLSEGFIDSFEAGTLQGYRLTQGVEGCGQYVYYFPMGDKATLVVTRAFVPELNSAISEDVRGKAEKLADVILPKESDRIFSDILNSFKYVPSKD